MARYRVTLRDSQNAVFQSEWSGDLMTAIGMAFYRAANADFGGPKLAQIHPPWTTVEIWAPVQREEYKPVFLEARNVG